MTGLETLLILALHSGHRQAAEAFLARQTTCMAQAIYYEARGESATGREAVAEVVLNRMRNEERTVCEIVFEPYQFSFTFDGSMKQKTNSASWADAVALAQMYASGNIPESQRSVTRGATHYHNDTVEPKWAVVTKVTAHIGHHIFYKL